MALQIYTIKQAAKFLSVSIDTLRRWDKKGKLKAVTAFVGSHRRYHLEELEQFLINHCVADGKKWAMKRIGSMPNDIFYCPDSSIFQARLYKLRRVLSAVKVNEPILSLLIAVVGEIGDNAFSHNLGNWPDVSGVFFGYNSEGKEIILADRGQGILRTLKRVKPALITDREALIVAFTEIISGRAPENRGNGLKYVRAIINQNPLSLFFQSGIAELQLKPNEKNLNIKKSNKPLRGCLAVIKF